MTMGCGEACPLIPAFRRVDWPVSDPVGQTVDRVREIRDQIRAQVVDLVASKGWGR